MEDVPSFHIFAVDPPGEVRHQFVKHSLKKREIALIITVVFAVDLEPARLPRRARVDSYLRMPTRRPAVEVRVPFPC
jgi:hypothetical protein